MSSELDELPAVYRALSDAGLHRLRGIYEGRLQVASSAWLRSFLQNRITYIDTELARRQS